jgi:DNA-binding NtrC family response regulator
MEPKSSGSVESPNLGVRVFVADEDITLRAQVSESLLRAGFDVTECGDGAELFRRLGERPRGAGPRKSIVVAQIRLPVLNALQILHSVRRLDARLPFILITHLRDVRDAAEKAGATAVLAKPFATEELVRLVARLSTGEDRSMPPRLQGRKPDGDAIRPDGEPSE